MPGPGGGCGGGRGGGGAGGRQGGVGLGVAQCTTPHPPTPSGGWIPEIAAAPIMLTRVRYVHRLRGELSCGQKGEKAGSLRGELSCGQKGEKAGSLRGELSCGQKGEKTGSHHHRQRLV